MQLVDTEIPALRCRPLPRGLRPTLRPPAQTRRPSLGWRLKQIIMLVLNLSVFVPAFAWVARRSFGLVVGYTELHGRVLHADGSVTELGLLSRRIVTTAGVNFLAACFDGTNTITNLKYHAFGTGTTAAAVGDTALQTETSDYATSNTRPTGMQSHSTNTYTTYATFSPTGSGTLAVTEWGLLSQAATGGGTLFDHMVFSAVNLTLSSDSMQTTFVLTLPNGG